MRNALPVVVLTSLVACGAQNARDTTGDASPIDAAIDSGPPPRGFQIVSPSVDVLPGTEVTFCYYFHTPNTTDMAIKQWVSHMTGASHHMILFFTPSDQEVPGTLTTTRCGFAANSTGPVWAYAAQTADAQASLPADDGNHVPVSQNVKAGQSGFLLMHFLNATDAVVPAHVELNALAYDEGVQTTPAAPYVTYSTRISLAAAPSVNAPTTGSVSGDCNVDPTAKFYVFTTHTHKQGVRAIIKDGATQVFAAASWDHPGEQRWSTAPFFSFTSGKLSYECDYSNPNNYAIKSGDNMTTDETCMAIGYFFPAATSAGHYCLDKNAPIY
jgi:hypothetical protein